MRHIEIGIAVCCARVVRITKASEKMIRTFRVDTMDGYQYFVIKHQCLRRVPFIWFFVFSIFLFVQIE